jgi:hypothetical protein
MSARPNAAGISPRSGRRRRDWDGHAKVHVTEEYLWPGGFLDAMRRTAPRVVFAVNPTMAVVINAMFIAGTIAAASVGARAPVFALSAAALIAVNGCAHVVGTLHGRRYVPGAVTGLLISQPAAVLAYLEFAHAGLLSPSVVLVSLALGAGYHLIPPGYFGTLWMLRRDRRDTDPVRLGS